MRRRHLDFETASAADLSEVGAYNYSKHKSTHILCAATCIGNSEPTLYPWQVFNNLHNRAWYLEFRQLLQESDEFIVAHNAPFEIDIINNVMELDIPASKFICTMAKCYYHSLPGSLDLATQALDLPNKKNPEGKRLLAKLSAPKKDGGFWTPDTAPEDFESLYVYCCDDVRAEVGLDEMLMDLPERERAVWLLDHQINRRGIHIDRDVVERVVDFKNQIVGQVVQEFREITGLNPTQRAKFKEWLAANYGLTLPDMQAPTLKKVIDESNDGGLIDVLILYGKANLTSLAKFEQMKNRMDDEGIIREIAAYHGAHTGRWAGRGVQFQNMKRPDEDVDISVCLEALLSLTLDEFRGWYGS